MAFWFSSTGNDEKGGGGGGGGFVVCDSMEDYLENIWRWIFNIRSYCE